MPQRKGRQTNNKKKSKKGQAGHGQQKARTAIPNHPTPTGPPLKGSRPSNFDDFEETRRKTIQAQYATFYSRYKAATSRFIDYMIDNTPNHVEGNRKSVNFLVTSVDWMVENRFVLDPRAIKDLKLCLRLRSRAAKSVFGGGDAGHRHFVTILTYCWSNLVSLPRSKQTKDEMEPEKEENHYAVLMEEDDEEDEETFPSTPPPRPELQPETALSLEDLVSSDERNDVILFFMTLDELMSHVAHQYNPIPRSFQNYKRSGAPESAIMEEILEAAVATNMAIQQVQQMEMDLQMQYSHLTTPYRLLSTLAFPELTLHVAEVVREHGTSKPGLEHETTIFLGDCLECAIRAPSDPSNRKDMVVPDFSARFQINETGTVELEKILKAVDALVVLEVPIMAEKKGQNSFARAAQSYLMPGESIPKDHSWLQGMPFIGGDRAIHHTLRLIQAFGTVISTTPHHQTIEAKRGIFGPSPWQPGRAKKIHGDLDELLMADILPQWVLMMRKGIWRTTVPRETELCPLFVLMRQYIEKPEASVTWSLTFAVHALLTAVFEMDIVLNPVFVLGEALFANYFEQLKWASRLVKNEREMSETTVWRHNMFCVSFLENLGLPVFGRRALWNPLCFGTTFSCLTFFGNLEVGCALVDCQAQLRITVHLFHALRVCGILRQGQIPILDMLYDSFKTCKAVWEGALPKRGEFVQKFWICFGMKPTDAKTMAVSSKLAVQMRQIDTTKDAQQWKQRKMHTIEPAEIATCYRRICNRDFHDVVDNYHTEEQRRRSKGTDMYSFAVRANDTLDAIEREHKLLSINLPSCAVVLEQFVCSLGRVLQWGPLLSSSGDARQAYAIIFAQHLLGALDFAQDPVNHEFLNVPMGLASSSFMSQMFSQLDPARVLWFQAVGT